MIVLPLHVLVEGNYASPRDKVGRVGVFRLDEFTVIEGAKAFELI